MTDAVQVALIVVAGQIFFRLWGSLENRLITKKVDAMGVVVAKTEKLVNNKSGIDKRALMVATALNAKLQPSSENIKLAEDARQAVVDHDANQSRADAIQDRAEGNPRTSDGAKV